MKKLSLCQRGSAIALAISAGLSAPLVARAADAAAPTAGDNNTIQEVVVTAERREESLQKVPISVTALSADTIEKANVATNQALDVVTPGLVTTNVQGGTQVYIRGVGSQGTVAATESSVAQYVDGVYIASLTGAVYAFNNIERVEVLRGPQGTLFGRNATGGVIQVITRKPSFDPTLRVSASYGNYDTSQLSFYGSTGFTDMIAGSLAVYTQDQGKGFGRDLTTGKNQNYLDDFAARGEILIKPTDKFSVLYSADYDRQRNDLGSARDYLPGEKTVLGTVPAALGYDTAYNYRLFVVPSQWGISQDVNIDLGFGNLRSITAWREYRFHQHYDQDATTARIIDVINDNDQKTFQQEFLLSGHTSKLDWTTGAFFFYFDTQLKPIETAAAPVSTTNVDRFTHNETTSYAAYAQGTYAITDDLKFTGGLRYTADRTKMSGTLIATAGSPLPVGTVLAVVNNKKLDSDKITWRFALDYQINPNVLVYVSDNRGYKSGQFNTSSITQVPTTPETLDAYEIGLKSEFFDHHVRVNASAFHYDYRDLQLVEVAPPPINIQTLNAASAKENGGEFEVIAAPPVETGHLEIGANFTVLDAKYDSFPSAPYFVPNPYSAPPPGVTCAAPSSAAPGGNTSCKFNASGNTMIRSPKWTAGANIDYSVPLAGGELDLSMNYYHSDGFYWETSNRTHQAPYDVLNAQVAYDFGKSGFRVRVFGRNITDERYFAAVTEQAVGDIGALAPPRTYGIGVDYKWH
jgi:iron complex outermembrane receptor protein